MIGRSHPPDFSVDLGPRADADPLAREIRRRIVANLEHGGRLAAFRRMWGTVVIVAVSEEGGGTPTHTTLTLRFDWGRLMIHEGRVGRPDVTLWGTPEGILSLGALGRWPRLPPAAPEPFDGDATSEERVRGSASPSFGDSSRRARFITALGNLQRRWTRLAEAVPRPLLPGRPSRALRVFGGGRHPRFLWRLARLLA